MKQAKFFIGMMVFFVIEKSKKPYLGGGTVNGVYPKSDGSYCYEITNSAGKIQEVVEANVFNEKQGADALAEFTVRCTPAPVVTETVETEEQA